MAGVEQYDDYGASGYNSFARIEDERELRSNARKKGGKSARPMHTDYKAEKLKPENILKDVNWEHSCPYSFEVCAAPAQ